MTDVVFNTQSALSLPQQTHTSTRRQHMQQ